MADNEPVVETVDDGDDLNAFEAKFFGTGKEEKEVETSGESTPPEEESQDEIAEDVGTQVDTPAPESEDEVEVEEEAEPDNSLLRIKTKKTAKERIDEITALRRAAERERDEARREVEELKARALEGQKSEPTAKSDPDAPDPDALEGDKPKYPLGEFDRNYIADLTRYTIRKEADAAKAEEAKARQEREISEARTELENGWSERLEAAKVDLPDFEEKAPLLEAELKDLNPQYGEYLAAVIMSLEAGPQVLHYLANNIPEARKIVASGPAAATIALGRLEARFVREGESNSTRPTKAPEPPMTNKGSGGSRAVRPDTDDLDAFEKQFFK